MPSSNCSTTGSPSVERPPSCMRWRIDVWAEAQTLRDSECRIQNAEFRKASNTSGSVLLHSAFCILLLRHQGLDLIDRRGDLELEELAPEFHGCRTRVAADAGRRFRPCRADLELVGVNERLALIEE